MSDLFTLTVTVEAHQWLPGDPRTAGRTIGWLLAAGASFEHTSGTGGTTTLTITTANGETTAQPGDWIVHHLVHGYSVAAEAEFGNAYEPVKAAPRQRRRSVVNTITGGSTGTVIQSGGDVYGDINL